MIATNHEVAPTAYQIKLQSNPSNVYRKELRRGVGTALTQGQTRIVVDCASWSQLDLLLLSALMNCASACDEQGARFELVNLARDLRSRIDALRLGGRLGLSA